MGELRIEISDALADEVESSGLSGEVSRVCQELISELVSARRSTDEMPPVAEQWEAIRRNLREAVDRQDRMRAMVLNQVRGLTWEDIVCVGGNGADDSEAEIRFRAWHQLNLKDFPYAQVRAVWAEMILRAFHDLSGEQN